VVGHEFGVMQKKKFKIFISSPDDEMVAMDPRVPEKCVGSMPQESFSSFTGAHFLSFRLALVDAETFSPSSESLFGHFEPMVRCIDSNLRLSTPIVFSGRYLVGSYRDKKMPHRFTIVIDRSQDGIAWFPLCVFLSPMFWISKSTGSVSSARHA
jgi:hypothetical protein